MRDFGNYFNQPLTRYRLLAGFTALVMTATHAIMERAYAYPEVRWVALVSLSAFALFGWQRWIGRWAHLTAFIVFLSMLANMSVQLYETSLAQDYLVSLIAVLVLMSVAYTERLWLNLHLFVWVATLVVTAALIPDPQVSLATFIVLMLFMGLLMYSSVSGMIRSRKRLALSETLLAQSQALAKVGGWELVVATQEIRLTDSAWDVLGVLVDERHEFIPEAHFPDAAEYEAFRSMVDDVIKTGGPIEYQARLQKADGTIFWAQVRAIAQRESDRSAERVLGVFSDVTDTLAREDELRAAKEAAESASLARTRFLANMSHEIRTPMNGVIGMTSLLMESNLPDQERGYVEVIRSSGDSLLNIINEILDFSKYESGQLDLEAESFSLETAVSEVLDIVATLSEKKNLRIYWDSPGFPVSGFVGDVSKLRQVLVNLMSNAIKFTEQGSVTLKLRGEPVAGATTALTFSVIDTGIGIAPEALSSLFDPFTQEDASIARRYGGTGLGLAISKEIVAAMGGELQVESRLGEGSTFSFTIPVETGQAEPLGKLPNSRSQVCIVTADTQQAELLARQVTEFGGKPSLCTAVDDLDFNKVIDVLIVDLDMISAMSFATLRSQLPTTRLVALARISQRVPKLERNMALLRAPVRHSELWVALQTEGTMSHEEVADDGAPVLRPLRLLLAEDNSVNQMVALQMLRKLGFTADVASDGEQAVALVRQQDYDVVFMDIQMPEMDGLQATRVVRASRDVAQPYIVAMTANAMSSDREECEAAGMDDFVAKPVRIGELQNALKRAAERLPPPTAPDAAGDRAGSQSPY